MRKNRLEGYSVNKIAFFHPSATYFIMTPSFNQTKIETESVYIFILSTRKGISWLTLDLNMHLTKKLKIASKLTIQLYLYMYHVT